jgi:hypothetical protein
MLKQHYGLTEEQYDEMETEQGGCCAICGDPPRNTSKGNRHLHVDHDHNASNTTVRGLLCEDCNLGIGRFFDSPSLLRQAIAYLEKHGR